MPAAAERSLRAPPTMIRAGPAPDRSNAIEVPSAERTVSVIVRCYVRGRVDRHPARPTWSARFLHQICDSSASRGPSLRSDRRGQPRHSGRSHEARPPHRRDVVARWCAGAPVEPQGHRPDRRGGGLRRRSTSPTTSGRATISAVTSRARSRPTRRSASSPRTRNECACSRWRRPPRTGHPACSRRW